MQSGKVTRSSLRKGARDEALKVMLHGTIRNDDF